MKGNLLLIDDETELSESMSELLEEEAQIIYTANNGSDALEIIKEHQIDCVVTDIKMPVMDGLCFMKLARKMGFTKPIIFFTGHGTEQLKEEIQSLGATDLLLKPNFLKLELAIRKYMVNF